MRIVLVNPPSSARRKPILPMSLLALGALLDDVADWSIVDGNLEPDFAAAVERAVAGGCDLLGVTVMPGPQLEAAVPLCREVRRRHPSLPVVWGGYFPSQHWESCLRAPCVDWVVRGHGEAVFRELARRLAAGADPRDLPGLAYRDPVSLEPRSNPMAPIPHPAELPDLPVERVPLARYLRRTFLGERTIPQHTSYGCPFFCNFCAVVNLVDGRWVAQPAERVAATVRRLVSDHGVDAVEFHDNNFFVSEARVAAFAKGIRDLGIRWWGEARIDTMLGFSEATWRAMAESGLAMVFLGAESGSDETLRRMDKGGSASAAKTLEIAERCRRHGIVPEMSFVLGNPPDPDGDVEETLSFVAQVKRVHPGTEVILYMYTPVPLAGELFERAREGGFRFPETLDEWVSPAWKEFSQRRSTAVPGVGDPLRRRVRNFERVLNARFPTTTDRRLTPARRALLRGVAGWRWATGVHAFPLELALLDRLLGYQRPETSGF